MPSSHTQTNLARSKASSHPQGLQEHSRACAGLPACTSFKHAIFDSACLAPYASSDGYHVWWLRIGYYLQSTHPARPSPQPSPIMPSYTSSHSHTIPQLTSIDTNRSGLIGRVTLTSLLPITCRLPRGGLRSPSFRTLESCLNPRASPEPPPGV